MTIHPAFQAHGTFCYIPDQIARYYKHYPRGFETAFVRLVIDSWRATGFNQNLTVLSLTLAPTNQTNVIKAIPRGGALA